MGSYRSSRLGAVGSVPASRTVIVPDLRHDMHSGPVGEADVFLRRLDRELATSSSWRPGTVLVVTFDEGTTSRGPHGRGGGHVATVVTGPGVPARHDATPYTHYALLRSIEQRFGLPPRRRRGQGTPTAYPRGSLAVGT